MASRKSRQAQPLPIDWGSLVTAGLLVTSFVLGLRHGVDWDHIAAIADLTSSAGKRKRGFVLSICYALGHAAVVFALGCVIILVGASIPTWLDDWMGRVVGVTLVVLGVAVLWDLKKNRGEVRLRSRWMLIIEGTFAGIRKVARYRDRRRIVIEHSHDHSHDENFTHTSSEAHDHSHSRATANLKVPTLQTGGGPRLRDDGLGDDADHLRHEHTHRHYLDLPTDRPQAAAGVATGVGMLHGVGIESPTQIAIFVASTSVLGAVNGIVLLLSWVVGLVVANAALAVAAGRGLLSSKTNGVVMRVLALVVAILSIALGLWYIAA